MPSTSPVLKSRAAVGVAVRRRDKQAEENARRELAAEKLAAYVERVVAEAPALTPAQRDRIAALLRGGRDDS